VITPLEGTPASRKGIRAGDVISTIEGEPTETMGVDEAVRRLKGPRGTSVTIEIARRGMPDLLEVEIVRDEIPQNSVRYAYMLDDKVGYLSLTDFNRGTAREMEKVIDRLRAQGMDRLLLDLRSNGGGLLDQAIAVANLFVPAGGKIVETRGRTRESFQDFHASDAGPIYHAPIVVLVGGGTASAAEILSGAIQDHDIGLVVGTPTWGKGLVQTVYSLSYGNGLSVTTAKYYTPSGRLIQRDYSSWYDYQYDDRAPVEPTFAEGEAETFYTDLGRKVYGGGGITPDVVAEPDDLAPFVHLLARSAFFNFAVELNNRETVGDRSWSPQPGLLDEFQGWLLAQELIAEKDLAEGLAIGENREMVLRYLRAEVLGAAFGLEARHRVLVQGDSQVVAALTQLDEAEALLAERRRRRPGVS
jgi:carboxyl-terminal processing protease